MTEGLDVTDDSGWDIRDKFGHLNSGNYPSTRVLVIPPVMDH